MSDFTVKEFFPISSQDNWRVHCLEIEEAKVFTDDSLKNEGGDYLNNCI